MKNNLFFDPKLATLPLSSEEKILYYYVKNDFDDFFKGLKEILNIKRASFRIFEISVDFYCSIEHSRYIVLGNHELERFWNDLFRACNKSKDLKRIKLVFDTLKNQELKIALLDSIRDHQLLMFLKQGKYFDELMQRKNEVFSMLDPIFSELTNRTKRIGYSKPLNKIEIRSRIVNDLDQFLILLRNNSIFKKGMVKDKGGGISHSNSKDKYYGNGVTLLRFIDSYFGLDGLVDCPQTYKEIIKKN